MHYVQFFQNSVWGPDKGKPMEATGDRSVVILDGRESIGAQLIFSRAECAKRGYVGFQLFKGDAFSRSEPYTKFESIPHPHDAAVLVDVFDFEAQEVVRERPNF